jgi:hypothetical protein
MSHRKLDIENSKLVKSKYESTYGLCVSEYGFVTDPGEFEAEPLYTPHLWHRQEEGEEMPDGSIAFEVTPALVVLFPMLTVGNWIVLEKDVHGFVNSYIYPDKDTMEADIQIEAELWEDETEPPDPKFDGFESDLWDDINW